MYCEAVPNRFAKTKAKPSFAFAQIPSLGSRCKTGVQFCNVAKLQSRRGDGFIVILDEMLVNYLFFFRCGSFSRVPKTHARHGASWAVSLPVGRFFASPISSAYAIEFLFV
jgi:hypothetical protein